MDYVAIVQARMGSSRLPHKVLKPILGIPMLLRQVERIQHSKKISTIIIATSTERIDDEIDIVCRENNIACFRGSLHDVLDRYYKAAKKYAANNVVRLTADCPLIDATVIDQVIHYFENNSLDYASNTLHPTFPDGLDVEVFRFSALERAFQHACLKSEREHVTPFLKKQENQFNIGSYEHSQDYSAIRLTVDYEEDLLLVRKIYEMMYPENPAFSFADILTLITHNPWLTSINSTFIRDEGYAKSLQEDEVIKDE